jgi:hypothetical protein
MYASTKSGMEGRYGTFGYLRAAGWQDGSINICEDELGHISPSWPQGKSFKII